MKIAQTIYDKNAKELHDKVDELFMEEANRTMIYSKLGAGKDIDEDYLYVLKRLDRIMCEDNCRLKDLRCELLEKINIITISNLKLKL